MYLLNRNVVYRPQPSSFVANACSHRNLSNPTHPPVSNHNSITRIEIANDYHWQSNRSNAHTHTHTNKRNVLNSLAYNLVPLPSPDWYDQQITRAHTAKHLRNRYTRNVLRGRDINCNFTREFLTAELSRRVHRGIDVIVRFAWFAWLYVQVIGCMLSGGYCVIILLRGYTYVIRKHIQAVLRKLFA